MKLYDIAAVRRDNRTGQEKKTTMIGFVPMTRNEALTVLSKFVAKRYAKYAIDYELREVLFV